jgi:hypothetical protein
VDGRQLWRSFLLKICKKVSSKQSACQQFELIEKSNHYTVKTLNEMVAASYLLGQAHIKAMCRRGRNQEPCGPDGAEMTECQNSNTKLALM